MVQPTGSLPCLMKAWKMHEHELYCWLLRQTGNQADTDDLIQEIFLRAVRQQRKFCAIVNTRACCLKLPAILSLIKTADVAHISPSMRVYAYRIMSQKQSTHSPDACPEYWIQ